MSSVGVSDYLNTRRDTPNLRATVDYLFIILIKTFSQRFPTTFRRFPKILRKLSEGHKKNPKITENVSIITNLSTI